MLQGSHKMYFRPSHRRLAEQRRSEGDFVNCYLLQSVKILQEKILNAGTQELGNALKP